MRSYSGSSDFEFEIERYRHKETDELLTYDEYISVENENDYEYITILLSISGSSYYSPGRTYGPVDKCYPDEGDTEVESVIGPDGKDWEDVLTANELSTITEMVAENASEDNEDYYDRVYDR